MNFFGIIFLFSCRTDTILDDTSDLKDISETEIPSSPNATEQLRLELLQRGMEHLQNLSEISTAHENRAAGSLGYDETVMYLISQGQEYGYNVDVQDFMFYLYHLLATPEFEENAGETTGNSYETSAFWYSPAGNGDALISSVDLQLPPSNQANSSTSGCEIEDFDDFPSGHIALIQRGSCTFTQKAQLAEQAGAVAVVIFNEGQLGRQDIVEGFLDANSVQIPVFGMSFEDGQALSTKSDVLFFYNLQSEIRDITSQNVFFQPPSLDESYIMLGGHADSVFAGGGLNDNGSGIAAILSIAKQNANQDLPIRYAFWGGEELGLLGSYHFISDAYPETLQNISSYINLDMIASPNFARMIYDGDGSLSNMRGPNHSDEIEAMFEAHFDEQNLHHQPTPFDGRSDYGPFIDVGIAAGGLFTGAEGMKTEAEEAMYGGDAGKPYDECYHEACDDILNINDEVFGDMILATFSVLNDLVDNNLPQYTSVNDFPSQIRIPQSKCHHTEEEEKEDNVDEEEKEEGKNTTEERIRFLSVK